MMDYTLKSRLDNIPPLDEVFSPSGMRLPSPPASCRFFCLVRLQNFKNRGV